METDTKSLFQITEAAHACGVSRSTLMRMEEKGLLAVLEERLQELLQGVEELRLRAGNRSGMSVQLTSLHAVTCCMKKCMGRTVEEKYAAMYGFYSECIRKG